MLGRKEKLRSVASPEVKTSPNLPMPDFLASAGVDRGFWDTFPPYVHQAAWIGGRPYLQTFLNEGTEWNDETAGRALGESCFDAENGLIHREPFLVGESNPVSRFGGALSSSSASELWRDWVETTPEICSRIGNLSPRIWVVARSFSGLRDEEEVLRSVATFFSRLDDPDHLAERNLFFPEREVGDLRDNPFGVEVFELLADKLPFLPSVTERAVDFFKDCSPEEWALLRFLANRSDVFWQGKDDQVLETIRKMNHSTLKEVAVAVNKDRIPPDFLDDQAQLFWPQFSPRIRARFSGMRASEMDWLRRGGKGHFKLPEGRPSDSLIIVMAGFLDDRRADIFRGLSDVPFHLEEMVTGRRVVSPEEEREWMKLAVQTGMGLGEEIPDAAEILVPVPDLSSGAREMTTYSRPAGMVLHNLVLGLWAGDRSVTPDQREGIEACVKRIQGLAGDSFSDKVVFSGRDAERLFGTDYAGSTEAEAVKPEKIEAWLRDREERERLMAKNRRWTSLLKVTTELQERLDQALRTDEESEKQVSIFGVLDLEEGSPDSYRKQAVAVRGTMAVANEVLNPLIGPEEVFVSEPMVIIQDQHGDCLGFDIPDGLLITGLDGEKLDPVTQARLRAFVKDFPEIRVLSMRLGVDFCALVERIKEEFGVSNLQTEFIEAKSVMGRRLNRSRRQLRRLRKSDLETVVKMTLMTAVAWEGRQGKVDRRDVPDCRVVYLRPLGTRALGFRVHSHNLAALNFDPDNSVRLGDEDRSLIIRAIESLRGQVEASEIETRKKSRSVLIEQGGPLAAVLLGPLAKLEDDGRFGQPLFPMPAVGDGAEAEKGPEAGQPEPAAVPVPVPEQTTLLVDLDGLRRVAGEVTLLESEGVKV